MREFSSPMGEAMNGDPAFDLGRTLNQHSLKQPGRVSFSSRSLEIRRAHVSWYLERTNTGNFFKFLFKVIFLLVTEKTDIGISPAERECCRGLNWLLIA